MNKKLTLSLIIPAYNEEDYLRDCLDAVARQTVMPDEVIVVDNNSTDSTASIARSYSFVTVIHETQQGLIPARNRGFDAAIGDIIGRIDADSIINSDWTERVLERFNDDRVDALTGCGLVQPLPYIKHYSRFWPYLYHLGVLGYLGYTVMWGANMAFRADIWPKIVPLTASADELVHEDQDLSLCMKVIGRSVTYDPRLLIRSDATRYWDAVKLIGYYQKGLATLRRSRVMLSSHAVFKHNSYALLRPLLFALGTLFMFLAIVSTAVRSYSLVARSKLIQLVQS